MMYAQKKEYTVLIDIEGRRYRRKPPSYKTEEAMLLDEMFSNDISMRAAMDSLVKKGQNKNSLYKPLKAKGDFRGSDEL